MCTRAHLDIYLIWNELPEKIHHIFTKVTAARADAPGALKRLSKADDHCVEVIDTAPIKDANERIRSSSLNRSAGAWCRQKI